MVYFKVVNRTTRTEHLFNHNEAIQFFKKNNIREYAVSSALSPRDNTINNFINTLAVSFFSVAFVILISNIIFNLIK
tara:strand:+ start:717 stop:947 length:231 start_codon:yes stop_codon:yes gene_type:complete